MPPKARVSVVKTKPETVLEDVVGQLVRGDREVLHQPREVAEAEVDDLDPLALDETQDLGRRALLHSRVSLPRGNTVGIVFRPGVGPVSLL